ncbi:MAG: hypothetical protein M3N07_03195 [Pseudomonadota bacterium]|nr:hypothetical protein [Pseudomonadota bacterium]
MTRLYRAGFQLTKVKAFIAFSAALALAACWWGWELFNSYGLSRADGGVLAPFRDRVALGFGVAALGLTLLAGMWFYGRLYVTAVDYDEAADALHVRTLEFLGSRETVYPAAAVRRADYVEGRSHAPDALIPSHGVSVDAPWFKLRLAGRRVPLILDAKGEFGDAALVKRLLKLR